MRLIVGLVLGLSAAARVLHANPQEACAASWGAISDVLSNIAAARSVLTVVKVEAVDNDWCRVDATGLPIGSLGLGVLAFRPGDTEITANVSGFAYAGQTYEGSLRAVFAPDSGALFVARAALRAGDGHGFAVTGNFTLQSSIDIGAVQMSDAVLQIYVTPGLLAQADVDLSDLSRSEMTAGLRDVDQSDLNDRSRRALKQFAGATPSARGTLEISFLSIGGFSLVEAFNKVVGSQYDGITLLAQLFSMDISADVVWKPGRL